jgi:type I restriction-modification system DNA methylase subunit
MQSPYGRPAAQQRLQTLRQHRDDHGDPEELLQKLEAAEKETANLRDQLKAILEKALLR